MANRDIFGRIIHKHDSEENWLKATNFIPKQGEIIIYDKDANVDYERMKIGDGVTTVINLPFYLATEINQVMNELNNKVGVTIDDNNQMLIFTI